jgi:hypothetical protein
MRRFVARVAPVFLLTQISIYILLPFSDGRWHSVVPEHDHLFLAGTQAHAAAHMDSTELDVAAAGASRPLFGFGETVIHAFNPAAALQVLTTVMGFGLLTVAVMPRGLSQRVAVAELFLRSPFLLPLDPPPVA